MYRLKRLSKDAIPRALDKATHYRLLNEPRVAESICRDVLEVEPDNQQALATLLLALTDRFAQSSGQESKEAFALAARLTSEYERHYYTGIVHERLAKAWLAAGRPGSAHDAYESLRRAMDEFEKAEALRPPGNDDALLRWNNCVRLIARHKLVPRPEEDFRPLLE